MNRDAFNRHVVLRKDREHSWRHHARNGTLLKEVLGMIDKMASKWEREKGIRFVFIRQSALLKLCFKGDSKEKKNYALRHLRRIFKDLRAEHVISNYFETADGMYGFLVAPHGSLCHVRDGVCILQNRSIPLPHSAPEAVLTPGMDAALAALKVSPTCHSTRHHDDTQHVTMMSPNMSPGSRIEDTEHVTEHVTDESLYLSNFELLTENEKADWLESRKQLGASIPCIPVSLVSSNPLYPSILSIQDELKRHHEFLESKSNTKGKNMGVVFSLEAKPKTEEPKTDKSKAATMKSQRRKPIVPTAEYQKMKADGELTAKVAQVFTEADIEQMHYGKERRSPCQEGNDIIWRTDAERIKRGWTVLSGCTIHDGYRCSFGQACWHKA